MPVKRTFGKPKTKDVFGQSRKPAKMLRAGLYARVSTLDQQTLPMADARARRLLDAPATDTLKGLRDRAILATLLY